MVTHAYERQKTPLSAEGIGGRIIAERIGKA